MWPDVEGGDEAATKRAVNGKRGAGVERRYGFVWREKL
jgi:hypothetical protein